jgi:pimeloyl-ACP methyl ester carboxylesterase
MSMTDCFGDPISRAPRIVRADTPSGTVSAAIYGTTGPYVVLLHGIPGSRASWDAVAPALAESCRVIVPDLLGFGESIPRNGPHHLRGQADGIMMLLNEIGADTCHLVGFDFGGPIAVTLCRRDPGRCLSLVLLATNVFRDTPIPAPLRLARIPLLGDLWFRMLFGRVGLMLLWHAAVRAKEKFPKAMYLRTLHPAQNITTTREIFLMSMRDLRGLYDEAHSALSRMRVPTTVVWADQDPFFPVPVGEAVAAQMPHSRLVVLNGCGHFIPQEKPAEVISILQAQICPQLRQQSSRNA